MFMQAQYDPSYGRMFSWSFDSRMFSVPRAANFQLRVVMDKFFGAKFRRRSKDKSPGSV